MSNSTLWECIDSWLQCRAHVLAIVELAGDEEDVAAVTRWYEMLLSRTLLPAWKAETTRKLAATYKDAMAIIAERGPSPVDARLWEWGKPGSAEDRAMLEEAAA